MAKLNKVYLSTGTNLGDRRLNLITVEGLINLKVGPVVKKSAIYETAAWGVTEQPDFYNQVLLAETTLPPAEVLREILEIEKFMGRVRLQKWGARLIDIDILYYRREVINEPHLKIPHPFLQDRKFVLIPLSEIAPDYTHPLLEKSNEQLLKELKDESEVRKLDFN